jgi:SAM-dependent methyltransferase
VKNPFTENIREAPLDEPVCWCSGVTKRAILEAQQQGARNMDVIRRMTGACTVGRYRELSPRGRCCSTEIMLLLAATPEKQGKTMDQRREEGTLNGQNPHWEKTYTSNKEMFGEEPSAPARRAAELFKQEGMTHILELGGGQGRDTVFFATSGFTVTSLDYAETGIKAIDEKAQKVGVSQSVTTLRHDVRQPLPFPDESFDASYSHMLFCMALTTADLEFLSNEVKRVLKPGGLCVYTVRHTFDPHCGTGISRGEDMYEVGGFIVHFFSRKKVEHLAKGYQLIDIDDLEEGPLPRKLYYVIMRKDG